MNRIRLKKNFVIVPIVFIAFIAIVFIINKYNKTRSYNELINSANKYMDSGKYDEAIALYEQSLNYRRDSNVKDSINFAKGLKNNKINNDSKNQKQDSINNNLNNIESKVSYGLYKDNIFGFSIEYPNILQVKSELPENGDGIILATSDNNTKLTVWGINNVSNDTPQSLYAELLKQHPNSAYKRKTGNIVVFSWAEGNNIIYEKRVVGSKSINSFTIKYPISKKSYYDPVVAHLYSSFKTAENNENH